MKRVLRNLSVSLMTAILFVASTGFTVFSHICLMDGDHKISTQKVESCCAHPYTDNTTALTANCCIDNSTFLKFDYAGFTQRSIDCLEFQYEVAEVNFHFENIRPSILAPRFHNLPPPLSGREILLDKQVIRI